MDRWIEFIVVLEEEKMVLNVFLFECTSSVGFEDTERIVGEKSFRIWPWSFRDPQSIEVKVNKIKRKLLDSYMKNRKLKDSLIEATEVWGREWYSIKDMATDEFIANAIKKDGKKKNLAKVIPIKK